MAVLIVSQFRVNPGKNAAFNALLKDLAAIIQRHGARTRALQTVFGGPNSLLVTFITENDDMASHGSYMAKVQADPDFGTWQGKFLGADAAATLISNSVAQDLPL